MNNHPAKVVSLHPYFKVHPGKLEEFKALMREFVARAASEPARLFYDFTINGDEVFCRELYEDGAGALAHLENVDCATQGGVADRGSRSTGTAWARRGIGQIAHPPGGLASGVVCTRVRGGVAAGAAMDG
jgi:hypothetical protein